jgi:two-component system, chemotaxis family, chemotaxis protein CheY
MSRVLIVEDSPTMAQLLVFIIKKLKGVEIDTANDGANGLKKLSEGRYDLVLTDINMPLIDGLKFVSLLRNDGSNGNKDVPVIIITTEGEDAIMQEGLKLGANSYITKPVNSQRVIETVKKFINA